MYKFVVLVLALVAVAAAQYLPYAYTAGVRSSTFHGNGYAATPLAYSGLGGYGYQNYGYAGAYGAYPYYG